VSATSARELRHHRDTRGALTVPYPSTWWGTRRFTETRALASCPLARVHRASAAMWGVGPSLRSR
jgi:hypothetical protein